MKDINPCPPAEDIMAWMDNETSPDNRFADHIAGCVRCRMVMRSMAAENRLMGALLDEVPPLPDLSTKIMSQINGVNSLDHRMAVIPALALLPAFIIGLMKIIETISAVFHLQWPGNIIAWISLGGSLLINLYQAAQFIAARVLAGDSFQAAVILAVIGFSIPFLQKIRRIKNA